MKQDRKEVKAEISKECWTELKVMALYNDHTIGEEIAAILGRVTEKRRKKEGAPPGGTGE